MRTNIDDILSWMDFKKIADVLDFLNQGWAVKGKDVDDLVESGYRVLDDTLGPLYIPKEKDVLLKAKEYLDSIIEDVLDAEENGMFRDNWHIDGVFYCGLQIIDDETRKDLFGEDAPDDFEHSVDIKLRFVLEECPGKFE